jgi:hypothetical protein
MGLLQVMPRLQGWRTLTQACGPASGEISSVYPGIRDDSSTLQGLRL